MAMDDDGKSAKPATVWLEARLLEPLSVGELRSYIAALQGEIARAEAAIAAKQSHRAGADAFFKKS